MSASPRRRLQRGASETSFRSLTRISPHSTHSRSSRRDSLSRTNVGDSGRGSDIFDVIILHIICTFTSVWFCGKPGGSGFIAVAILILLGYLALAWGGYLAELTNRFILFLRAWRFHWILSILQVICCMSRIGYGRFQLAACGFFVGGPYVVLGLYRTTHVGSRVHSSSVQWQLQMSSRRAVSYPFASRLRDFAVFMFLLLFAAPLLYCSVAPVGEERPCATLIKRDFSAVFEWAMHDSSAPVHHRTGSAPVEQSDSSGTRDAALSLGGLFVGVSNGVALHGRDKETERLTRRVSLPPTRILAVCGARGVGKTALVKSVLSQYGGRVAHIDLRRFAGDKRSFAHLLASQLSPDAREVIRDGEGEGGEDSLLDGTGSTVECLDRLADLIEATRGAESDATPPVLWVDDVDMLQAVLPGGASEIPLVFERLVSRFVKGGLANVILSTYDTHYVQQLRMALGLIPYSDVIFVHGLDSEAAEAVYRQNVGGTLTSAEEPVIHELVSMAGGLFSTLLRAAADARVGTEDVTSPLLVTAREELLRGFTGPGSCAMSVPSGASKGQGKHDFPQPSADIEACWNSAEWLRALGMLNATGGMVETRDLHRAIRPAAARALCAHGLLFQDLPSAAPEELHYVPGNAALLHLLRDSPWLASFELSVVCCLEGTERDQSYINVHSLEKDTLRNDVQEACRFDSDVMWDIFRDVTSGAADCCVADNGVCVGVGTSGALNALNEGDVVFARPIEKRDSPAGTKAIALGS